MINKIKIFTNRILVPQIGLFVLAIFYFIPILDMTTLSYSFPNAVIVCKLIRYICYIYFLLVIFKRVKSMNFKEYMNSVKSFDKKQWAIVIVILLALFGIAGNLLLTGNKSLALLLFILIYASCFKFEDVENIIFSTQFIALIIIVTLSSSGLMYDYVNNRVDGTMRHSLGFGYPAYSSQFILFLILYYSYKKNFKISSEKLGLYQLLIIFVYFLTDSRTEFLLSELILICIFLNSVDILSKFKKQVDFLKKAFIALFPLYPIGSFVAAMSYGVIYTNMNVNSTVFRIAQKVNSVFTNRLYQTFYDFKRYGFSLFGSNINLVGYFLSKENENSIIRSNFIDNEYMRILFENGWIFFIAFFAIASIVIWYLYKNKKDGLLFISFVITTISLVNSRILSTTLSIFCFMIIPVLNELLFKKQPGGSSDE